MSIFRDFFEAHGITPRAGSVHDLHQWGDESKQLADALRILEPRFAELTELADDLQKTSQVPRTWEKALTEGLGLAELQALDKLGDIGYPKSTNNKKPEFEGTINIGRADSVLPKFRIPFDIKSAYGSGAEMVRDQVEGAVAEWAKRLGGGCS